MKILRVLVLIMLAVVFAACSNGNEKAQVEEGKKSKEELVRKPDEKEEKKVKTEKPDYKALTEKTLNQYLKKLPEGFNNEDFSVFKPYLMADSDAYDYVKKHIKNDDFKNYEISKVTIGKPKLDGKKSHTKVTRIMKSNATNNETTKVVTIFDLEYDKKSKKMKIYDFNDQSVTRVHKNDEATTEEKTSEPTTTEQKDDNVVTPPKKTDGPSKQQAKGDANTCIVTRFQSSCEGVSDSALYREYKSMVATGNLPEAPYDGCAQCTIQYAFDIQDGKKAPYDKQDKPKVKNMIDAVQMVNDNYRKSVEEYYPEKDVAILGTEPIGGTDVQEDAGGKYYKVRAVDKDTKELLQSYKVYIQSGEIIAE